MRKVPNYPIFPQRVCNVTQSWNGSYNHYLYSSGRPADYPIDIADADGSRQAFYAPCRMECVKIYGQITGVKGVANGAWFTSVEPCDFPDGTRDYLTIKFVHMNNDDFPGIRTGRIYEKYEYVGREGTTGEATGNHLHVTAGKGRMKGTGWTKNSKNQWVLQTTGGQFKPDSLLWLDPAFTQMRSQQNMAFQTLPQEKPTGRWPIGTNVRLALDTPIYDNDGNQTGKSFDQSCVKIWDYNGRYFICTTGWNGANTGAEEHGIGWVDESALSEWTQLWQIGGLYKYWGGTVLSTLNGVEPGYPVSGPWTVVKVIDYKPGEHPYFLQDTHNGVYMGWVSEYTIGAYQTADATLAAQYVAGSVSLTDSQQKIYDLNADGKLTLSDVTAIAKIAAGT